MLPSPSVPAPAPPAFREALRFWLKLGCVSFGGPAGQIAMMHRELVERRRWISEDHFLHALNFCMLLPGPEATQLAVYLGWRLHGWRGGVAAGVLFILPAVLILFGLSWLYMARGETAWLKAVFYGLMAAVIAVVAEAVLRIGKKALRSPALWTLAGLSFAGVFVFSVSFVYIIAGAALLGWMGSRVLPSQFPSGQDHGGPKPKSDASGFLCLPPAPAASWRRTATVIAVCLTLWILPTLLLGWWTGGDSSLVQQGLFFSQTALITFGGAYAVLPYVAAESVARNWLTHPQMMAGLALAETTPGPLIMVLQFVGFAGGWRNPPPGMPELAAGTLGALITTWVTFVPSFLFVFLGGPYVEHLRRHPRAGAALTAVTAAVVGVILNLGVVFAQHALWPGGRFDWFIAVLATAAFVALWRFRAGLIPVLASCAAIGFAWRMLVS